MNKLVRYGFNVTYKKDSFDDTGRYIFTRKQIVGGSNYSDGDTTEEDTFTISVRQNRIFGKLKISMWFNFHTPIDGDLLHMIDDFVKELEEEDAN